MCSVQLTAILLIACVVAANCEAQPNVLPDISATGACEAEIAAYCSGAAAQVCNMLTAVCAQVMKGRRQLAW
jgi:hypothetical protein